MSAATCTQTVARQLGGANALRAKASAKKTRAPVRAKAARAETGYEAPMFAPVTVGEDGIRGVFKKQPPRDDLP